MFDNTMYVGKAFVLLATPAGYSVLNKWYLQIILLVLLKTNLCYLKWYLYWCAAVCVLMSKWYLYWCAAVCV